MHTSQAVAGGNLDGELPGVVERVAFENHPGSQPPACRHLHQRCEPGHDDGHRDAEEFSVVGKAEGMVAGRRRHHAVGPLGVVKEQQGIAGTAFLEASGPLEKVELAEHLGTDELGKRDAPRAWRAEHAAVNAGRGRADIGERHGRCHASPTRAGR